MHAYEVHSHEVCLHEMQARKMQAREVPHLHINFRGWDPYWILGVPLCAPPLPISIGLLEMRSMGTQRLRYISRCHALVCRNHTESILGLPGNILRCLRATHDLGHTSLRGNIIRDSLDRRNPVDFIEPTDFSFRLPQPQEWKIRIN